MRAVVPLAFGFACAATGCGDDFSDYLFVSDEWELGATVEEDALVIEATVATVHGGDFTHVSIRKEGWDNEYDIERSPGPGQPERDWSRPHRWFSELHPNTYLEGSIHDGDFKKPPEDFTTFRYRLDLAPGRRRNWPDEFGSEFQYITRGYSYADNNPSHPGFGPGEYEIEIYAWYTGSANGRHPATDGKPDVQFIHYEYEIVTATFTVE